MTLLNSCQVLKSLACVCVLLWHLQLITQLNRFLALQALVEHLGICIATFGLKFPILLNWVKFRPGIWDGGATSSTGRGAADSSPTRGCLGLAPSRLSKQWGMDILPIFLLRLGSSRLMWIASLASLVIWEIKDHWTTWKRCEYWFHSSNSLIHKCQSSSPYKYHPLQVFSSSLLMKTSCLRLKLVELNFLVSFNTDDQS